MPGGLRVIGWERTVRCGQLLRSGQRHKRIMHALCWWPILSFRVWEQWRQWYVRCGQFLSYWKWRECAVHGMSRGGVLPRWMQFVSWERLVRSGQLFYHRQRRKRGLHCVCCGNI